MRIPRWATRRFILFVGSAAVLVGAGYWAWRTLALRLEFEVGPGVRASVIISSDHTPPMPSLALPFAPSMRDDVQYFPPGPEFPWANTRAAIERARQAASGSESGGPDAP